jgi:hypothetical protein
MECLREVETSPAERDVSLLSHLRTEFSTPHHNVIDTRMTACRDNGAVVAAPHFPIEGAPSLSVPLSQLGY